MAKPIPQSDTRWVKKPGKAGYVEQISTGKKVTGKVKIESIGSTAYNSRGIAEYKGGRNTAMGKSKPAAKKPSPPKGQGAGAGAVAGSKEAEKSALSKRLQQNKGVKTGTIRPGAKGGGLRRYDAKTGRWNLVSGGVTTTANQNQNQSQSARRPSPAAGKAYEEKKAGRQTKPKWIGAGDVALLAVGKALTQGKTTQQKVRERAIAAKKLEMDKQSKAASIKRLKDLASKGKKK